MSQTQIHPSAIIEAGAELGEGVRIGPFCHVEAGVVLGDQVELKSHVSILRGTTLGERTVVWPFATLGGAPQNLSHKGGETTLIVGADCTLREGVTLSRGSDNSRGVTRIGDKCFLMAYSHVAHDCIVGDHVIMANQATLAGHCEIGDRVNIGGLSAVHQFVRIGHHAFVGGCSGVAGDLIPFGMATGNRAVLRGLNVVGMKRSGMSAAQIRAVRSAYREIFSGQGTLASNLDAVRQRHGEDPLAVEIIDFLSTRTRRPFCLPPSLAQEAGDGSSEG